MPSYIDIPFDQLSTRLAARAAAIEGFARHDLGVSIRVQPIEPVAPLEGIALSLENVISHIEGVARRHKIAHGNKDLLGQFRADDNTTIRVLANLPLSEFTAVALHEARHVHQWNNELFHWRISDCERDAETYERAAWPTFHEWLGLAVPPFPNGL